MELEGAVSDSGDLAAAVRHEYLQGLSDTGLLNALAPGQVYKLPLLQIPDIVIVPHETVPLILGHSGRLRRGVQEAVNASGPARGFVACVNLEFGFGGSLVLQVGRLAGGAGGDSLVLLPVVRPGGPPPSDVGRVCVCVAEVKSTSDADSGLVPSCILRGRYRALMSARQWRGSSAEVEILPDERCAPLLRDIYDGAAHCPPFAAKQFDAAWLAGAARARFRRSFPHVSPLQGPPERVSFWMTVHLPIARHVKQRLLQAPTCVERLRQVLEILQGLENWVQCIECSSHISMTSNVVTATEEGPGGAFVNEYGYVHDMLCLSELSEDAVAYRGGPETANSWFPGYAWTIMNCTCGQHLGWRFSRVCGASASTATSPHVFWGLRRDAIRQPAVVARGNDAGWTWS